MKKYCSTWKIVIILLFAFSWVSKAAYFTNAVPFNNFSQNFNTQDDSNIIAEFSDDCTKLGHVDFNYGTPRDVFIEQRLLKTLAFVADEWGGLVIVDINNLNDPKVLSQYSYIRQAKSVHVMNKIAFVTHDWSNDGGMLILDVFNPSKPKKIIDYTNFSSPRSIIGRDDYIFVADAGAGLIILDVSDPSNPHEIFRYKIDNGGVYDIKLRDHHLFLVGSQLEILDISDMENIELIGMYDYEIYGTKLHLESDLAIVIGWDGSLSFINISDLVNPVEISSYEDASHYYKDGFVRENILYVLTCYSGFILFDITDPSQPQIYSEINFPGDYQNSYFTNNRFYIADLRHGIKIFDFGDSPEEMLLVGQFFDGGFTSDVYVEDSIAYVANGHNGLNVVDVSDPTNPTILSKLNNESAYYYIVTAKDENVFLFNKYTSEIEIYDLSDPVNPLILSSNNYSYSTHSAGCRFAIDNSKLYSAVTYSSMFLTSNAIIKVIDISNIHNTHAITSIDYHDLVYDIDVQDDVLFLLDTDGLQIFDVSDPSNFTLLSTISYGYSFITGFTIENNYVYLTLYSEGLIILDITAPTQPIEVGTHPITENPNDECRRKIQVENNYAYVIDKNKGLLVFNVTDITNPKIVGQFYEISHRRWIELENYGENLINLFVLNNLVYLAASLDGLMIVHLDGLPYNQSTINLSITYGILIVDILCFVIFPAVIIIFRKRRS